VAGTDLSRAGEAADDPGEHGPAIVLVEPQLGENIGMVARAMLNCGLVDLRLVRPREPWPNDKAVAAASGADRVLDAARLFDTTAAAVADRARVYAATVRDRAMVKRVVTPRRAAEEMRDPARTPAAVLFGKEAKGLHNDDVALADTILTVPLNPGFASLNLAMAVLLVGYEWWQAAAARPAETLPLPAETRPATKAELVGLFEHLERELDACGFLRVLEKRPIMVRNLRNLFGRADLTEQEVRTLRGVIACLAGDRRRPSSGD
jgi:tRNA/rRNA methyltransferase